MTAGAVRGGSLIVAADARGDVAPRVASMELGVAPDRVAGRVRIAGVDSVGREPQGRVAVLTRALGVAAVTAKATRSVETSLAPVGGREVGAMQERPVDVLGEKA